LSGHQGWGSGGRDGAGWGGGTSGGGTDGSSGGWTAPDGGRAGYPQGPPLAPPVGSPAPAPPVGDPWQPIPPAQPAPVPSTTATPWGTGSSPYATPPVPPRRGPGNGAVVAIVVTLLAVVGVVAATLVLVADKDESDDEATSTTSEAGSDTGDGTGEDEAIEVDRPSSQNPDQDLAAPVDIPGDYVLADDATMPVTLRVPPDWAWAPIGDDATGVGERLAPDSPTIAARIDESLQLVPRGMILLALPEAETNTSSAFFTNANVLELPTSVPSDLDQLEQVVLADLDGFADEVENVSYVAGQAGPVLRADYTASIIAGNTQYLQYWIVTPDGTYSLTVASTDLEPYVTAADAMAASLALA
jgi:hypothetical protein